MAVVPLAEAKAAQHLQQLVWSTTIPPMSSILSKQEIIRRRLQPRPPQLPLPPQPATRRLPILDPIITTTIIITEWLRVPQPRHTTIRPFLLSFLPFWAPVPPDTYWPQNPKPCPYFELCSASSLLSYQTVFFEKRQNYVYFSWPSRMRPMNNWKV